MSRAGSWSAPSILMIFVLVAARLGSVHAADAGAQGALVFEKQCAPCHARPLDAKGAPILAADGLPVLAGSASLAVKYRGTKISPYIEERPELADAALLRVFLRNGSFSMPPFRKSELPDSGIEAIAAYLSATSKAAKKRASR